MIWDEFRLFTRKRPAQKLLSHLCIREDVAPKVDGAPKEFVALYFLFVSLSYLSYAHPGHWLFSFVLLGIDTQSRLSSSPTTTTSSSYTRASHRVWTGFSSNLFLFWSVSSIVFSKTSLPHSLNELTCVARATAKELLTEKRDRLFFFRNTLTQTQL